PSLAVALRSRAIVACRHETPELFHGHFMDTEVKRFRHLCWFGGCGTDSLFIPLERLPGHELIDLLLSVAQLKLTRRNQPQLHTESVGDLDIDAEMPGPGVLVLLRLSSVKGDNGERRGDFDRRIVGIGKDG